MSFCLIVTKHARTVVTLPGGFITVFRLKKINKFQRANTAAIRVCWK